MKNWDSDAGNNDDFLADFDAVKAKKYVPNGVYLTRVQGWKMGRNRKNTPVITVSFTIQGTEHAGKIILRDCYWTESSKEYSKRVFDLLGIDPRQSINQYPPIYAEIELAAKPGSNYSEVKILRRLNPGEVQERIVSPIDSGTDKNIPGTL